MNLVPYQSAHHCGSLRHALQNGLLLYASTEMRELSAEPGLGSDRHPHSQPKGAQERQQQALLMLPLFALLTVQLCEG